MKKNNPYILIFFKRIVIILAFLISNSLLAEENIGEVVAEHIDENFESDVHAALQNAEPESWSSWLNNNLDPYFPGLQKNMNSAYIAMGQVKSNLENAPSSIAATFNKRMQEMGYSVSPQAPGNYTNNMQDNRTNTSSQTLGNYTNSPPVTIVMQDRNVAQMSGENFIAAKVRNRKNITHATVNHDNNIRNVNLKLHSLYMSNIALSR